MSARLLVPPWRPEPDQSIIRSGLSVRSSTWSALALLADWLAAGGFGATVGAGMFTESTATSGGERVLNLRYKPRTQCVQRVWVLLLRGTTSAAITCSIKAPASTGTALVVPVPTHRGFRAPLIYVETVAAKGSTTAGFTIGLTPTGGDVAIDGLTVYELPRPVLTMNAEDYGVDAETERPGERIYGLSNVSVTGVRDALTNADARRTSLFWWAVPDNVTTFARTSASYLGGSGIFALGIPILARKTASGATTGSVKWSVYAKIAGGGTGKVKLTTSQSGVSSEITVTGASFAWMTAASVSVQCDDMASADGRQTAASPVWDEMTFDFKSDGANNMIIAAISVWEE